MRALGVPVETFSVRSPTASELRGEQDREEAAATYTLLDRPFGAYLAAHVTDFMRRPARYLRTLFRALHHRPPGLKAALLSLAHFAESILLAAELKRRGIVHLHNHFANSGATVGLLASQHLAIGWSFTIHGISEFDYPAGLLLPEKVAAARFVACVSYFGRAQAARMVEPTEWPKLKIVRCGLELDRLPARKDVGADYVRIIVVGRLSAEKGISGLLSAMAQMVTRPRARLAIVGDGPLRAKLKVQAGELGLEADIEFLGRLPEAETLTEIARSDVLVLPSFMEGLPIVLMEALALGVPVVAARVAGIPELVEDGKNGLLFSPSDWSGLANALDRLVADPSLRRRLGDAGPQLIAEQFDVRASAVKLRDLFQRSALSAAIPMELLTSAAPSTSAPSIRHTEAAGEAPSR
jgi:glycosyltransferase involved in cell wall biosynthesis